VLKGLLEVATPKRLLKVAEGEERETSSVEERKGSLHIRRREPAGGEWDQHNKKENLARKIDEHNHPLEKGRDGRSWGKGCCRNESPCRGTGGKVVFLLV